MTITGLKPETTYAVRLSAVNGKGVGELSLPAEFKTQPVRKYSPARSAPPPAISALHGSHLFSLTDLAAPSVLSVVWVGAGFVDNSGSPLKGGCRGVVVLALVGVCSLTSVVLEKGLCKGEFQ